MFEYNYLDAVEKRYNNIYSLGGETERSFFQNVGKIVNKKAFANKVDESVNNVFSAIEDIMECRKKYNKEGK